MAKNKPLIKRIVESKTIECFLIKRILSAMIGFAVGYVYYTISFSNAFQPDEEEYSVMVKWGVLLVSTVGCFLSAQCCCIAALCIPTVSAKSGRNVIQATILAWMLGGPIANILYHGTEAIRSISCVAELQDNQTKLMMNLIKEPIVRGLGLIVDESESLNKSQEDLEGELRLLQVELLTSAFGDTKAKEMLENAKKVKKIINDTSEEDEDTSEDRRKREVTDDEMQAEFENEEELHMTEEVDLAGNLRKEARRICEEIFTKAHKGCCKVANVAWIACMAAIFIPGLNNVICQFVWWDAEKKCDHDILDKKVRCLEELDFDDDMINSNYSMVARQINNIDKQFDMDLTWELPSFSIDEKAAVMTVAEATQGVKSDYIWRLAVMSMCVSIAQKFVAVTVILVLRASATYNVKYLTDYNFDNIYVSSYFAHKDRQRKRMNKRHLMPLTRLESKYVARPTDLRFTALEKKSMLFKIITLIMQSLFSSILFLFDGIVYFVMDLIARHGEADFQVSGRHRLEADIKGNGTVSDMLRIVFSGFLDNDHSLKIEGSNAECMPRARPIDPSIVMWTIASYVFLIVMILMEGYVLRIRRVICGTFYPKREKRRIIQLYNDLLRQRKQHIFSVRKAVLKLALTKRLNQKYGFFAAIRLKSPKLGKLLSLCGFGKLRCLICETPEGRRNTLWRCSNMRCRMLYCNICWVEVNEMCWACNSLRGAERALPKRDSKTKSIHVSDTEHSGEDMNLLEKQNM